MTTTLGATLTTARKQLGRSLRMAERISTVPNAHISQIETGAIAAPGYSVVVKLAKAYGLDGLAETACPEVAEAVAAERQRIIALARKLGATYPVRSPSAPRPAANGWAPGGAS